MNAPLHVIHHIAPTLALKNFIENHPVFNGYDLVSICQAASPAVARQPGSMHIKIDGLAESFDDPDAFVADRLSHASHVLRANKQSLVEKELARLPGA